MTDPCPCGSGASYATCCGPRHDGTKPAETPEALMRSRYSAFARGRPEYLAATWDAPAGEPNDASRWTRDVDWVGLTIERTEPGASGDEGFVTFTARSLEGGDEVSLQERSRFARRDGRWLYVDGTPEVSRRKLSRNEPCPCGSGRKFKSCHA